MNPNASIPNYENCETVEEARQILAEMNQIDLKFIHHFIVELGGTSHPYFFELRDQPTDKIKEWFEMN
jgi:hypothetical protein